MLMMIKMMILMVLMVLIMVVLMSTPLLPILKTDLAQLYKSTFQRGPITKVSSIVVGLELKS